MFKKLRDEITEKVKQSPLKFQTSVQQLTQVISNLWKLYAESEVETPILMI